ncbi:glycoside hydrolase family 3 protein [Fulvivirga ligni]|uniref:glycoside hydrolase family 3 protein n=1 Tax=Fulvivirga ligni TaxID=2904246 RepID=UPI001F171826|nr:glycoside hydrolase family 3 N-terminal domain-containing protein [Fulvivirga ligni]UII22170.1 glycoside hydrolase family 3 protein [Fulvivirga ligni]
MKKGFVAVLMLIAGFHAKAQVIDSLDFKIGQMLLVGYPGKEISPDDATIKDIKEGKVGGIILFEKNISPTNSYIKLKQLTWTLQKEAPLPLFMAIDQEGGRVNRLKEKYGFPKTVSAAYLGQVANMDSTRFYAEMTASTLAGLGFNVNFAPVVDLAINKNNPVIAKIDRSYSENPDSVAMQAEQVIEAHRKFNIVTVLKHFPGHGSSHSDTHLGIADVTEYWQAKEVSPYSTLIKDGEIDAVMTAHIVNKKLDKKGLPGTLSKSIVTGLLRDSLNYDGVVFSDDMQMHAITKHYGLEKSIKLSIQAGVDVLIFSNNIQGSENRTVDTVHDIIMKLIKSGDLTEARIDESYRRILKLKRERIKGVE